MRTPLASSLASLRSSVAIVAVVMLAACGPAVIVLSIPDSKNRQVEVPVPPSLDIFVANPLVTNSLDPNRPYPVVPVRLRVNNLNSSPIRVRAEVQYVISSEGMPRSATLLSGGDTSPEFDIPARTEVERYVLWNVLADEGIGVRATDTEASVQIIAKVTRIDPAPVPAFAIASSPKTATTVLNTPLFGPAFTGDPGSPLPGDRTLLFAGPVGGKLQATSTVGGSTLDLFYGSFVDPMLPAQQSLFIHADQQFAAVAVTNLQPYRVPGTNGINLIVPTDFVPDQPDCLVQAADAYRFVTWDKSTGVPSSVLAYTFDNNARTTVPQPISFPVVTSQGASSASLIFLTNKLYGLTPTFPATTVETTLRLTWHMLVKAPGSLTFQSPPPNATIEYEMPDDPENPAFPVPKDVRYVAGEFDGNPETFDVVVGNFGTELANAAIHPGLFDLLTFQVSQGTGGALIAPPVVNRQRIPTPPRLLTGGGNEQGARAWLLTTVRFGGQTGLLLARQATITDALSLAWLPQAAGGFVGQTWNVLPVPTVPDRYRLAAVFGNDIDGLSGGDPDSDILLVGAKRTGASDDGPNALYVDVLARRNFGRPSVWRHVISDMRPPVLPDAPGRTNLRFSTDSVQFTDVNGDQFPDLMLHREDNFDSGFRDEERWYYVPSAFRGVTAGFAARLDQNALSRGPGFEDVDADVDTDVIANKWFYRKTLDLYEPTTGGLRGSRDSSYHVEQIVLTPDRSGVDVLSYDPDPSSAEIGVNRLIQREGIGWGVDGLAWIPLAHPGAVLFARPVMTPTSLQRGGKDVFMIIQAATGRQLYRSRFQGGQLLTPELVSSQLANDTFSFERIRRQAANGGSLLHNRVVEDIAFIAPTGIVLLEAESDYSTEKNFAVGDPGENLLGIGAACFSNDALEDLLVVTRNDTELGVARVRLLLQGATDPDVNLHGSAIHKDGILLMRVNPPYAMNTVLRGLASDRRAARLAQSCIVFGDLGGSGSELRFLQPFESSQGGAPVLSASVLRCPTQESALAGTRLGMAAADEDHDGVLEVIAADDISGGGPVRLVRRGQ